MRRLHKRHPQYGFAHHKGYSSAEHLEALRRFGPCDAHRRSFRPVRVLCGGETNEGLDLFAAAERE
jgi:ribonuclease HII